MAHEAVLATAFAPEGVAPSGQIGHQIGPAGATHIIWTKRHHNHLSSYLNGDAIVAYVSSSTVLFNEIAYDDSDVETIEWSAIEGNSLTAGSIGVVVQAKGLDAVAVWFEKDYDEVAAEEVLYGVTVNDPYRTAAEDATVSGQVYEISGSYVKFDVDLTENEDLKGYYRVPSDAVMYTLDEDGNIDDDISLSRLDEGDVVDYVVVGNKVAALVVKQP